MATELERLMVRIDATTEQLRREIDKADKKITQSSRHMERQNKKISQSFDKMGAAAKRFALTAASAFVTREIVRYADAYKSLENQIKVATNGIGDLNGTLNQLYAIAQRTRVPLEGTVTLFQRASMAANELGASQEQLFQFTENVSKALAIQGGSAASASGALLQLSQALGSGIVRAEEFNSILEGAFPIAQAAARGIDGASGSVAKLRQMIASGEVTSKQFFDAILSQSEELTDTFGNTTATIGQSFQTLENSLIKFVGSSKSVQSASVALSQVIVGASENLDEIVDVATAAAIFFGGKYVASLTMATAAQARKIQSSIAMASADAAAAKTALSAARANFVMSAQMAKASGNMALARAASIQLTAAKNAYTAAASRAAVATRALNVAMQTVVPLAAIAAIYEMIDGNESLIESERLLGEQMDETRRIMDTQRDEHGRLTKEAKAQVAERIEAYMKEIEALEAVLKAQLDNRSAIGLTLRGIRDFAGETVVEGIFGKDYQSLDEAVKRQGRLNGAIAELRRGLEDVKKPSDAARRSADSLTQSSQKATKATKESAKADEARAKSLEKQREEMDLLQKQMAEEFNRPFENAMQSVQNTVADTFESIFDGSVNSADDAADAMRRIFTRLAAEMATLAIFRPQVFSAGGFGALGGSMVNGATTQGGGFDITSLSSAGNLFTGGGLGQPIFGSGSTIGGGIDAIGNALGLGNAGFIGPMQPGQVAPLSGAFTGGAALAGFGGATLANILGLGGGIGGSIGGAAGGVAGTALGAQIGSVGGPIGAAAGAFLGTAFGGLFGGKKPSDKGQFASADIAGNIITQGGLTGSKFSQENRDAAISFVQLGSGIARAIDSIEDAVLNFETINVGIGNRDPFKLGFDVGDNLSARQEVQRTQEALLDAMLQGIVDRTSELPEDIEAAIRGLDFSTNVEAALADLDFIANFSTFGEIPDQMREAELAITTLQAAFAEAAETAERLGLSVDAVYKAEKDRLELFRKGFAQGTAVELLNMIDPVRASQLAETERFNLHLRDLQEIGASQEHINQATLLHQLRMQEITNQQTDSLDIERDRLQAASDLQRRYSGVESSFKNILSDLEFGRFTGGTPVANLGAMRARINELSSRAALGDIAAQEELGELLPAFLDLSGEVNGYNREFARDRELAQRVAENTLSVAERQISLQQVEIDKAQQQIDATRTGFANLESLMASLGITLSSITETAQSPTLSSRNFGANPELNRRLAQATGYMGDFGAGGFNQFLADNPQYANIVSAISSQPGFARGGLVIGPPGNDNIPARLSNREFVMRASAVRSIGVDTLEAMNASGRVPSGGDVSMKLDALINATMAVGRAVADSGNMNAAKQQEVVNALDGIKRAQQVAALA